jgi:hypothetical protein
MRSDHESQYDDWRDREPLIVEQTDVKNIDMGKAGFNMKHSKPIKGTFRSDAAREDGGYNFIDHHEPVYMGDREVMNEILEDIEVEVTGLHPQVLAFQKEYSELAKEYKKLQEQQYEMFAKKMMSYGLANIGAGNDNVKTEEQKYLSLAGIWFRSNDKIQRLKQLVLLQKENPLEDESTVDAWKDLGVYSLIAQLVTNGNWKK